MICTVARLAHAVCRSFASKRYSTCNFLRRLNHNQEILSPGSFIFPCYLVVSNVSAATTSLADAVKVAGFRRLLKDASSGIVSISQRETTIVLPAQVNARYLRLQRLDSLYLSIAEVQVYSERKRHKITSLSAHICRWSDSVVVPCCVTVCRLHVPVELHRWLTRATTNLPAGVQP